MTFKDTLSRDELRQDRSWAQVNDPLGPRMPWRASAVYVVRLRNGGSHKTALSHKYFSRKVFGFSYFEDTIRPTFVSVQIHAWSVLYGVLRADLDTIANPQLSRDALMGPFGLPSKIFNVTAWASLAWPGENCVLSNIEYADFHCKPDSTTGLTS